GRLALAAGEDAVARDVAVEAGLLGQGGIGGVVFGAGVLGRRGELGQGAAAGDAGGERAGDRAREGAVGLGLGDEARAVGAGEFIIEVARLRAGDVALLGGGAGLVALAGERQDRGQTLFASGQGA